MNQIKIDLERVISDIDRNIFCGYLENLAYGGIITQRTPKQIRMGCELM